MMNTNAGHVVSHLSRRTTSIQSNKETTLATVQSLPFCSFSCFAVLPAPWFPLDFLLLTQVSFLSLTLVVLASHFQSPDSLSAAASFASPLQRVIPPGLSSCDAPLIPQSPISTHRTPRCLDLQHAGVAALHYFVLRRTAASASFQLQSPRALAEVSVESP